MHVRRERIREPVEGQRGLVRDDAGPLGPQPCGDQLLVLARREVDEPVYSSTRSRHATRADVLQQQLRRVASLGCLPGGETALLGARCLEQEVPVRLGGWTVHAQIVTGGLVVRKKRLRHAHS